MTFQLTLLDITGADTGARAEIQWLPVANLSSHPDNPRLIYRHDIIDTIATSIAEGGFKPEYALLVRPFESGYQVISGHTRLKAAQQAGCSVLPCWVKDLDDEAAFMELVLANNQGELSPLEYGMHVLKAVDKGANRFTGNGLKGYAEKIGRSPAYVTQVRNAASVLDSLELSQLNSILDKAQHLNAIHKAPDADWAWLVGELVEQGWSVAETEGKVGRIKAIAELNCPDWLAPIIRLDTAKAKALNDDRIHSILASCINAAVEAYESLSPVELEVVNGEDLKVEQWDLPAMYVEALASTDGIASNLTPGKFSTPVKRIKDTVAGLKASTQKWKEARAKGAEKERLEAERKAREAQLAKEFSPVGILGDVREVLPSILSEQRNTFDLVLTDPPYMLSNGGITARGAKQVSVDKNFADDATAISPEAWMPLCLQLLKPGGVLVFSCTEHLNISVSRIEAQGFEFLERLFWIKRSAPPRLTPTGHRACVEEIWVCKKPGDTHFFNYELLKDSYWQGKQASNYLEFEQCSGNERLGWHDTQKPLKLWTYLLKAYCPDNGMVLDPFSGSGTTPVAAKQAGYKCTWVEQVKDFFDKASQRIDQTQFPWEVQ